jgi:hypothetical protein
MFERDLIQKERDLRGREKLKGRAEELPSPRATSHTTP